MLEKAVDLSTFADIGDNVKRLRTDEIELYLTRLNQSLTHLSQVLTKEGDEFVAPFLGVVKNSIECLILKHAIQGQDQIDFSLTIDPTHCGFPTVKDFYLLEKDKENAKKVLEQLPSRDDIVDAIRQSILNGRSLVNAQMLLRRFNYYSRVLGVELLKEYNIREPQQVGEESGKRLYTLEWNCIERDSHLPVFYRMYFTHDKRREPLHREPNKALETRIYQSQFGMTDLRTLVRVINDEIDEINPKLIYKYVIGPFYSSLTMNSPEINKMLDGTKDAYILKFRVERVASISVRRFNAGGFLNRLLGITVEKQVYGPLDNTDCRMIVPFSVKQNHGNCDERGNPCRVYAVTQDGDTVG